MPDTPTPQDTQQELPYALQMIIEETEPDQFIDLLCISNFVAGDQGGKIPVHNNRKVFEIWLTRRTALAEVEARIDELNKLKDATLDEILKDFDHATVSEEDERYRYDTAKAAIEAHVARQVLGTLNRVGEMWNQDTDGSFARNLGLLIDEAERKAGL